MTLFDTGASGNNFVSNSFVESHGLLEFVCPMKKKVKVANGALVEINSYLVLEISFVHADTTTTASVKFLVMNGLSMELVIGLPDICRLFREVLFSMMNDPTIEGDDDVHLIDPALISGEPSEPWLKPVPAQISEEEEEIPDPQSFDNELVLGELPLPSISQKCQIGSVHK